MTEPATLTSGPLEATFLPRLGMVCSSLRHEGEELLAQQGGPEAYAQRGSSFGIPLLYPWANRLSAWEYEARGRRVELDRNSPFVHVDPDTGLPLHGLLAASRFWEVTKLEAARFAAALDFGAHAQLLALFPFPHRVELAAEVADDRLAVRLTVTPTGEVSVPISFGFHPYLRCDRRDARIELPVRRRAVLDGHGLPTGEHQPVAPGELDGALAERTFDDSFDELGPDPVFSVADEQRSISIEFMPETIRASGQVSDGFRVAQVYAPPGSDYVCFEPMTAPVDALRSGDELRWVAPGESFGAEFSIRVR